MLKKINEYVNSFHILYLDIENDKIHTNLQPSKKEINQQDIQKSKKRVNISTEFKEKQKNELFIRNKNK